MFERLFVSDARAMNRYHKLVYGSGFLLVLVLLLNPGVASAQLYSGSLSGVVTDPSGAVVPGADVTLTDTQKGFNYKATTNATGRYLLRPLPPTNYSLNVKVSGFKTFTQKGIVSHRKSEC